MHTKRSHFNGNTRRHFRDNNREFWCPKLTCCLILSYVLGELSLVYTIHNKRFGCFCGTVDVHVRFRSNETTTALGEEITRQFDFGIFVVCAGRVVSNGTRFTALPGARARLYRLVAQGLNLPTAITRFLAYMNLSSLNLQLPNCCGYSLPALLCTWES